MKKFCIEISFFQPMHLRSLLPKGFFLDKNFGMMMMMSFVEALEG
jgi:hypothetical protein